MGILPKLSIILLTTKFIKKIEMKFFIVLIILTMYLKLSSGCKCCCAANCGNLYNRDNCCATCGKIRNRIYAKFANKYIAAHRQSHERELLRPMSEAKKEKHSVEENKKESVEENEQHLEKDEKYSAEKNEKHAMKQNEKHSVEENKKTSVEENEKRSADKNEKHLVEQNEKHSVEENRRH